MNSRVEANIPEPGIAREARRRYFRDEWKYEIWGAQGKLLAVQEALADADVSPRDLTPWHADMERVVDYIFPRIRMYSAKLNRDLSDYLVDSAKRYRIICEEAAARFSIPVEQIEEILTTPQQSNDEDGVTFL
ncbi:MAG: hypothetical protein E6K56_05220 [Ignavibacteria bacterium]|nr:MAG: hypothetical protein E6K56_05220 [Ignavibacteria bacterium]